MLKQVNKRMATLTMAAKASITRILPVVLISTYLVDCDCDFTPPSLSISNVESLNSDGHVAVFDSGDGTKVTDERIVNVQLNQAIPKDSPIVGQVQPRSQALSRTFVSVEALQANDIVQFELKGFYCVDRGYAQGQPVVLFLIPTGKAT